MSLTQPAALMRPSLVLSCCSRPDKGRYNLDLFIGYFLDSGKGKSAPAPLPDPGTKYLRNAACQLSPYRVLKTQPPDSDAATG